MKEEKQKRCDMCGNFFTGLSHNVVDENFNIQKGLIQCGDCFVGEETKEDKFIFIQNKNNDLHKINT